MNVLLKYSDIDLQQWQLLTNSSPVASWFQTPEAYEFFSSLPEIMQPFVIAVEKEKMLKGLVIGYVTKEKSSLKQFFTRRAVIYGGPLLAEDITDQELKSLLLTLDSWLYKRTIYVETRNFSDYNPWRHIFEDCGFRYQPHLNFHVDTSSLETINQNLGKDRKRNIKLSLREGATILDNPTIAQVKSYYAILARLYKTKVRTPLYEWTFFEKLYSLPSARFLLVQYNDDIIGGTTCVMLENHIVYEWFVCGEDSKYKNVFPSVLATYAGLQFAADHHCPRFDLMGAGTPDEHYGVRDFKARFGGELVEHGRFLRINSDILYQLGKTIVKLIRII